MKLQAIKTTLVNDTLIDGPIFDLNNNQLADGKTVDVPDEFVVNPTVFQVVEPPKKGAVRYLAVEGIEIPKGGSAWVVKTTADGHPVRINGQPVFVEAPAASV